jgi:hypothetical protein
MTLHDITQRLIHAELLRRERLQKANLKQFNFKKSGKSHNLWIEILKVAKSLLISKDSNLVSQKKEVESRHCLIEDARGRGCLSTKEHQVSFCAE